MDEDVPKTLSETLLWDVQRKKSTTPPVFWGLVLGRWDWKWLEKMMELKMLHWGTLEWLFWRVTIRILTKTSKCPLSPPGTCTPQHPAAFCFYLWLERHRGKRSMKPTELSENSAIEHHPFCDWRLCYVIYLYTCYG
jgi:hypothetical protein